MVFEYRSTLRTDEGSLEIAGKIGGNVSCALLRIIDGTLSKLKACALTSGVADASACFAFTLPASPLHEATSNSSPTRPRPAIESSYQRLGSNPEPTIVDAMPRIPRVALPLVAAALTIASEAHAYEIVVPEAEFHLTVQGDGEPGCVVFPESATIEKDCGGLDIAALRATSSPSGNKPDSMFAYAVEGGIVFACVEWTPHPREMRQMNREDLAAIASAAAKNTLPGMGSAHPVASVVNIAGVDMVELRVTMRDATGTREASSRGFSVPAPKGMVQIAFNATDPRAVPAMEAFAEKSMATMRVAGPQQAEQTEESPGATHRVERLLAVALVCGLLAAGVVYLLKRVRGA